MSRQELIIDTTGKSFHELTFHHNINVELFNMDRDLSLQLEGTFTILSEGQTHSFDPERLTNVDRIYALLGIPLVRIILRDFEPAIFEFEHGIILRVEICQSMSG